MAVFYTWAFQAPSSPKAGLILEKGVFSPVLVKIMQEVRNLGATGIRRAGKLHILCSVSAWTVNRPKRTGLGVE